MHRLRLHLCFAVLALSCAIRGIAAPPTPTPTKSLAEGAPPIGALGYPLGETITIVALRPVRRPEDGIKTDGRYAKVESVNGHKPDKPVSIRIETLLPECEPQVLQGYTTALMIGWPEPTPEMIAAAKAEGRELAAPQAGWQLAQSFVPTSTAVPASGTQPMPPSAVPPQPPNLLMRPVGKLRANVGTYMTIEGVRTSDNLMQVDMVDGKKLSAPIVLVMVRPSGSGLPLRTAPAELPGSRFSVHGFETVRVEESPPTAGRASTAAAPSRLQFEFVVQSPPKLADQPPASPSGN